MDVAAGHEVIVPNLILLETEVKNYAMGSLLLYKQSQNRAAPLESCDEISISVRWSDHREIWTGMWLWDFACTISIFRLRTLKGLCYVTFTDKTQYTPNNSSKAMCIHPIPVYTNQTNSLSSACPSPPRRLWSPRRHRQESHRKG